MKTFYYLMLSITASFSFTFISAQQLTYTLPETDGTVNTIAHQGDTVYIGGTFNQVFSADSSGKFIANINPVTGSVNGSWAKPNSYVSDVVPDGRKGFYLSGDFTKVGDSVRYKLAHIDSLGRVTSGCNVPFSNSVMINSIALKNDTLYFGGGFSTLISGTAGNSAICDPNNSKIKVLNTDGSIYCSISDGTGGWYVGGSFQNFGTSNQRYLVHIDSAGNLFSWNPLIDGGNVVTLYISGNTLYVGGDFLTAQSQGRSRFAAFNIVTGSLLSLNPGTIDNTVNAITALGNEIFIGGNFTHVSGSIRNYIASFNASTGSLSSWNPNSSGIIRALSASGNKIYAGGLFTSIGGASRTSIAAIDTATGNALAWNYPLKRSSGSVSVRTIVSANNKMYIGGDFDSVAGIVRKNLAAFDLLTGNLKGWSPTTNSTVLSINVVSSSVYIAGGFSMLNGLTKPFCAVVDTGFGLAGKFDAGANGTLWTIMPSGNHVFVGGSCKYFGETSRMNLAAVDPTTSKILDWAPAVYGGLIYTIALSGNTILAGGSFSGVGGLIRNNLSSIDLTTGLPNAWNPNPNTDVYKLVINGNTVYCAGSFSYINGINISRLAALDINSGNLRPWNPAPNGGINAVFPVGKKVYVSGNFTIIGGQTRNRIACLDSLTGNVTTWNPDADNNVYSIGLIGNKIYCSGSFGYIGNQYRKNFACLDTVTGSAQSLNLISTGGYIGNILDNGNNLLVTGSFIDIGGQARKCVAAFNLKTGITLPWNANALGYSVNSLVTINNTLYLGGFFYSMSGQTRNNIASFDMNTGNLSSWNPNSNGVVNVLTNYGTNLYVGGSFTTIAVQSRNRLAAFDLASGSITSWDPNSSGSIFAMTASGSTIYAGGIFTTVAGQSRKRMAAIDITTGYTTSWNVGADDSVRTLALSGSNIIIGGGYSKMDIGFGYFTHPILSSVNNLSGSIGSWSPKILSLGKSVNTSLIIGNTICIGGTFDTVSNIKRPSLASIDLTTGNTTSWNPLVLGGSVYALHQIGNMILVGGNFNNILNQYKAGLAAISADTNYLMTVNTPSRFCIGNSVKIPFYFNDTAQSGNIFTAQLSDSTGSFSIPLNIGTHNSSLSDTINAIIPKNIAPGSMYRVRITSSNPAFVSSDNGFDITLIPYTTSTITSNGPTSFCKGGSALLKTKSGAGYSYKWLRNGAPIVNNSDSFYYAAITGAYRALLIDNSGCSDTSSTINVTVNPQPIISVLDTTTICIGGKVRLKANTGAGLTYQWRKNGANIANAFDTIYTAITTGNYCVVETDANSCTDSSSYISVTALPLPSKNISFSGPLTFCQGDSVVLKTDSSSSLIYKWKINGSTISTAHSFSYTAAASGNYLAILTDSYGCKDSTVNISITVKAKPITSSITGSTNAAIGSYQNYSVTFTNSSIYNWIIKKGIQFSGSNTSSIVARWDSIGLGTINVVETNINNCRGDTVTKTVTIVLPDSLSLEKDSLNLSSGSSMNIIALASNRSWYVSNGASWIVVNPMSYTGNATLNINVTTNSSGSTRVSDVIVTAGTVTKKLVVTQTSNSAVDEINLVEGVRIYPNPSSGFFTLENNRHDKLSIRIYDITGNIKDETDVVANSQKQFNIVNLPNGIYFIKVGDKEISCYRKLIKQ